MRVAIVYDRVNKWGGAERVLLALNELFPDAPLYTSVYSPKHAQWAHVFPKVIPSFLQKIPLAKTRHELLPVIMPLAFEHMNFAAYDFVISVTSEAAKGIVTSKDIRHICYCLTPTRYLWSGYETYFPRKNVRQVTKPIVNYLRRWDRVAAQRPDKIVSISKEVQARIKKYYKRDSEIIYPPVNIHTFTTKKLRNKNSKKYFLLVSRLVPYKKVDLVVETFNELGRPLVIIGTGSQEKKLRRMAKSHITFVKDISDKDLRRYYQNAIGFIMPQNEDFGMVSVEAQAAGLPVIAFKKGGALDTVIEGRTGIFFEEQRDESLRNAVTRFESMTFNTLDLYKNAQKFSKDTFKRKFSKLIDSF